MNKWTTETQNQAIEMLKVKKDFKEVGERFGMSASSVKRLYYSQVNQTTEAIKCEVCQKDMKQITYGHLASHGLTLEQYQEKFPNAKMSTEETLEKRKDFKNPNKGKTYSEIYGKEEGDKKREMITQKQKGRILSSEIGKGISGVRKDTGVFARSTYTANVDRIFMFKNKKTESEFSKLNKKYIINFDEEKVSYQPDRIDSDGLFSQGALLEIKGYISPRDWKKIKLFREQYPTNKLLVISPDKKYADIDYNQLRDKYKKLIPLWEDEHKNYKNRPDLYKIGFISSEQQKYLFENFIDNVSKNITDKHIVMICKRCVSFSKVILGKTPYIESATLLKITETRKGITNNNRGAYNYELWKVTTTDNEIFYVTNLDMTTAFRVYKNDNEKINSFFDFFEGNNDMSLKYGIKNNSEEDLIEKELFNSSDEHKKYILTYIAKKLINSGLISNTITEINLIKQEDAINNSKNDFEEWEVIMNNEDKYILSNFNNPSTIYSLLKIEECGD